MNPAQLSLKDEAVVSSIPTSFVPSNYMVTVETGHSHSHTHTHNTPTVITVLSALNPDGLVSKILFSVLILYFSDGSRVFIKLKYYTGNANIDVNPAMPLCSTAVTYTSNGGC